MAQMEAAGSKAKKRSNNNNNNKYKSPIERWHHFDRRRRRLAQNLVWPMSFTTMPLVRFWCVKCAICRFEIAYCGFAADKHKRPDIGMITNTNTMQTQANKHTQTDHYNGTTMTTYDGTQCAWILRLQLASSVLILAAHLSLAQTTTTTTTGRNSLFTHWPRSIAWRSLIANAIRSQLRLCANDGQQRRSINASPMANPIAK